MLKMKCLLRPRQIVPVCHTEGRQGSKMLRPRQPSTSNKQKAARCSSQGAAKCQSDTERQERERRGKRGERREEREKRERRERRERGGTEGSKMLRLRQPSASLTLRERENRRLTNKREPQSRKR